MLPVPLNTMGTKLTPLTRRRKASPAIGRRDAAGPFPFTELIEDMQSLIALHYLDDLSRLFFAMTSRPNRAHYSTKKHRDTLHRWIPKIIGRYGTVRQLDWFIGRGWSPDFFATIKHAIRGANLAILSALDVKMGRTLQFSHKYATAEVQCGYEVKDYCYDIGLGGMKVYEYFRKQCFELNEFYVASAAAYGGQLDLVARLFNEFSLEDVGYVFLGAALSGRIDSMDLVLSFRKASLTDPTHHTYVDPVQIARQWTAKHRANYVGYLKYLEAEGRSVSDETFLAVALNIGALDAVEFLEAEHELSRMQAAKRYRFSIDQFR